MSKRLTSILVVVLCMALTVAAGISVSATEGDGAASSVESVSSAPSSEETSSITSSETATSSDEETSSEEGTSSEEETSSDGQTSSEEATGSQEETSSNETSSKPITSGGAHDSDTFIEQTGSELASDNTVSNSGDEPISSDYSDGVEDEIEEEYEGKTSLVSDKIYKIIWIPIVVAVLCIAGLVVVNVMFRKKYPKAKTSASRRGKSSSYEAPKRRNRK